MRPPMILVHACAWISASPGVPFAAQLTERARPRSRRPGNNGFICAYCSPCLFHRRDGYAAALAENARVEIPGAMSSTQQAGIICAIWNDRPWNIPSFCWHRATIKCRSAWMEYFLTVPSPLYFWPFRSASAECKQEAVGLVSRQPRRAQSGLMIHPAAAGACCSPPGPQVTGHEDSRRVLPHPPGMWIAGIPGPATANLRRARRASRLQPPRAEPFLSAILPRLMPRLGAR